MLTNKATYEASLRRDSVTVWLTAFEQKCFTKKTKSVQTRQTVQTVQTSRLIRAKLTTSSTQLWKLKFLN